MDAFGEVEGLIDVEGVPAADTGVARETVGEVVPGGRPNGLAAVREVGDVTVSAFCFSFSILSRYCSLCSFSRFCLSNIAASRQDPSIPYGYLPIEEGSVGWAGRGAVEVGFVEAVEDAALVVLNKLGLSGSRVVLDVPAAGEAPLVGVADE